MTRPSLQDYGTYGESTVPDLWNEVLGAWSPSLGPSGTRLQDYSRYNRSGTLTSMDPPTDWVVSNAFGCPLYALDFDGVNDYVTTTTSLNNRSVVGISLWYWRASNTVDFFCGGGQGSANGARANIYIIGSTLYMTAEATTSTANYIAVTNFTNTGWMHIFYRYNGGAAAGSRLQPYLNGKPLNFTVSGTLATTLGNVGNLEIGRTLGEGKFGTGRVAEVISWSRDLSNDEIRQLYELGPGGMFQRRERRYSPEIVDAGGQTITANLLSNTSTLYDATVTAGAVDISANLLTNTSTFYDATISAGTVNINADLLTNTSTFYNATVTAGAVTISADLLSNVNTFYNAVVSIGDTIVADLYTNNSTIYNAVVSAGTVDITANLLTNTATIYLPTVTQLVDTIVADRLNNTSIIYLPTLTGGSTAPTDTSDILTKVSDKRKRRKLQQQLEEENIAAQILKSRQGKQQKAEEPKKAFEIKIKTKQEEVVLATPEIEKPATVELSKEQVQDIQNAVTQFKIKQNNNKKIQTLLFLASTLDD